MNLDFRHRSRTTPIRWTRAGAMIDPMNEAAWPFDDPAETPAFVCRHVFARTAPILVVVHEGDGDWQFLCDQDHGESSGEQPEVMCLEDVLALDPAVAEIGRIGPGQTATRLSSRDPWQVHDDLEADILASIERVGWHVCVVSADDEGPGFAFSIGLFESFGHPELICFGPPPETLAALINAVGQAVRDGARFEDGSVSNDIIEGNGCAFRTMVKRAYRDFLGYALWFYDGDDFPVLQLVLPDRQGNFPWEQGASEGIRALPALWEDQEGEG
jgi:hypothetical protein